MQSQPSALRFVLVDDDPINNLICRKKLLKKRPDLEIKEFLIARQALEYFLQSPTPHTDLLLLDINMPDMDAWSFLEELAKNKIDVPVVIITSSIDEDDLDSAKPYKAIKSYIIKPLTDDKVRTIIALLD